VKEATLLLQKLAQLHEMGNVAKFLATSRGRARVRALHHLSGGNHRIYIVLSQFITQDSVDLLVEPFMQMVDELTPYYQERIRWLPPLQRKIIECLADNEGTMPVKEIAKRLFATHQTISSQLQDLREKGYVMANQRGRESLYEISEPLMRICIEVKDHQRSQPLRLLVDFLRVWYDDRELPPKTSLTAIHFIDGK
jgi:DNA-binding transcriptional ArsR family regulator